MGAYFHAVPWHTEGYFSYMTLCCPHNGKLVRILHPISQTKEQGPREVKQAA